MLSEILSEIQSVLFFCFFQFEAQPLHCLLVSLFCLPHFVFLFLLPIPLFTSYFAVLVAEELRKMSDTEVEEQKEPERGNTEEKSKGNRTMKRKGRVKKQDLKGDQDNLRKGKQNQVHVTEQDAKDTEQDQPADKALDTKEHSETDDEGKDSDKGEQAQGPGNKQSKKRKKKKRYSLSRPKKRKAVEPEDGTVDTAAVEPTEKVRAPSKSQRKKQGTAASPAALEGYTLKEVDACIEIWESPKVGWQIFANLVFS